ncbi:MAG: hypothetical protein EBS96_13005, partial [Spartobacteria bacterium]|nr:hypothetical protein [Spartobacteria bacterium]
SEVLHEPWRGPQPVPLDRCYLFQGCDTDDLTALYVQMPVRDFASGSTIINSGAPGIADLPFSAGRKAWSL